MINKPLNNRAFSVILLVWSKIYVPSIKLDKQPYRFVLPSLNRDPARGTYSCTVTSKKRERVKSRSASHLAAQEDL